MNHYETAMLLSPALSDKDVSKFVQEARELLTRHGASELAPEKTERRSLAYPVKKHTEGTYVFISFDGPASLPAEMRTELRHRDELLRLAFIRKPERALQAEADAEARAAKAASSPAGEPEAEAGEPDEDMPEPDQSDKEHDNG
ncbi:MAG: 30S ribosomal protein S6 [candidate division WOR-3 bacterium]|nr:MAG: 30S ribosomal protein S6 [candidate division WOR-3 bacterium]